MGEGLCGTKQVQYLPKYLRRPGNSLPDDEGKRHQTELEIYDSGHLHSAEFLLSQGLLEPPLYFQFVMGILGGIRNPDIADVLHLKETADRLFGRDSYQWSAFGAGRSEFPLCAAAALMGGNCRVGMEDNLYLSKEDWPNPMPN